MDAGIGREAEAPQWEADRHERLSLLRPIEGLPYGLSLDEARRLLAYTGFSLFRAARAARTVPDPAGTG